MDRDQVTLPRPLALALLGVVLVVALVVEWCPAPVEHTVLVRRVVTVAEARRDLPPARSSLVHRLAWADVAPRVIETSPPGTDPIAARFCVAAVPVPPPDSQPDTTGGVARATPRLLLLVGGQVSGRNLVQHGTLSDGEAWRGEYRLRWRHGGIEWRADGDSLLVRERRQLALFGLPLRLGVAVGWGCTMGGCGAGAVGGVTLTTP